MNLVKTVDDQRPGSSNNLISFSYDKQDKRTATYYAMANGDLLAQKTQWDNDGQPTCIYSYRSPDSDPAPDGTTCPDAGDDTLITFYGYWYKNQAGTRTSSKHGMLELNGHYTTYAYDHLMRLRSAKTKTALSGGSKLRDFVYDYDRHSNLTQENTTGSTPGLETGNLWAAHNTGDEICAALRNADGAGDPGLSCGSTTSGQTSYTHDATGNMLTATGGTAATLGGFTGSYNQPGQTTSIDPPGIRRSRVPGLRRRHAGPPHHQRGHRHGLRLLRQASTAQRHRHQRQPARRSCSSATPTARCSP